MTSIYLNSSPSPFPTHDLMNQQEDDQTLRLFLTPNFQPYSSSNSLSSTIDHQVGFHQQEADNFGARSYDQIENDNEVKGLKFSIWKKEVVTNDDHQNLGHDHQQVKWMSSKMRVMLKMKKPNPMLDINVSPNASPEVVKVEDQKLSLSPDQNYSSNSSSSNTPIRVCSDCNTTKTPLWRSGPQGPKTLCNACGIRQRKARRAMAAAAAESGTIIPTQQASPIKAKLQIKDKKSPISSGHITKYKKKCKPSPPSSPGRKNCFENFLISLSKNLAFQRVFPQDEKEAAILLMALSCGYVHG